MDPASLIVGGIVGGLIIGGGYLIWVGIERLQEANRKRNEEEESGP